MADNNKQPAPTHIARALKRERVGKSIYTKWLEVGSGRRAADGSFHAYLDRTPIGGWTGYVHFAPIGAEPPPISPERPNQLTDEEPESLFSGDDEPVSE